MSTNKMSTPISTKNLLETFDILLSLQCNFDYSLCAQIFPNNTDHYWQKWQRVEGNMLIFINSLDIVNRTRFFNMYRLEQLF